MVRVGDVRGELQVGVVLAQAAREQLVVERLHGAVVARHLEVQAPGQRVSARREGLVIEQHAVRVLEGAARVAGEEAVEGTLGVERGGQQRVQDDEAADGEGH